MLPLGTPITPEELQSLIVRPPPPQASVVPHTPDTLEKMDQLGKLATSTFSEVEVLLEKLKQEALMAANVQTATAVANLFINVKKVRFPLLVRALYTFFVFAVVLL